MFNAVKTEDGEIFHKSCAPDSEPVEEINVGEDDKCANCGEDFGDDNINADEARADSEDDDKDAA